LVSLYSAPVRYVTKTWSVILLDKKTYTFLSQVYCVGQVVKTPTIISNNPVEHTLILLEGTQFTHQQMKYLLTWLKVLNLQTAEL